MQNRNVIIIKIVFKFMLFLFYSLFLFYLCHLCVYKFVWISVCRTVCLWCKCLECTCQRILIYIPFQGSRGQNPVTCHARTLLTFSLQAGSLTISGLVVSKLCGTPLSVCQSTWVRNGCCPARVYVRVKEFCTNIPMHMQ